MSANVIAPVDLVAPLPVQIPAPISVSVSGRQTLVFAGQLLAVLLLAGLWVGVQCVCSGAGPSEAQQTIAGP